MSLSNVIGLRRGNKKTIPCRTCLNAKKGQILSARCRAYPNDKGKPDEVYFDNAPCPRYKAGEDLLPYEIEI